MRAMGDRQRAMEAQLTHLRGVETSLMSDNHRLRGENERLRQRIAVLETSTSTERAEIEALEREVERLRAVMTASPTTPAPSPIYDNPRDGGWLWVFAHGMPDVQEGGTAVFYTSEITPSSKFGDTALCEVGNDFKDKIIYEPVSSIL